MRIGRSGTLGVVAIALGLALFVVGQQNLAECQTALGRAEQVVSAQATTQCQRYEYMRLGGGGLAVVGGVAGLYAVVRAAVVSGTDGTTGSQADGGTGKPGTFRERLIYKLGIGFSVLLLPTSVLGVNGFINVSTSRSGTAGITFIMLLWTFVPPAALLYFFREYRSLDADVSPAVDTNGDSGTASICGFEIYNDRFEDVVYRIRCRTGERVAFQHEATLGAGEGTQVEDLPETAPFELTVAVKDGPTASEIIEDEPSDENVTVRIESEDIDITRTQL